MMSDWLSPFTEAYRSSTLRTIADRVDGWLQRFEGVYHRSIVFSSIQRIESVTRESYLYGWLTTEPDPDVIVIDLRETYTIGPLLAFLERVVASADRTFPAARATRVQELVTANAVQILCAVLFGLIFGSLLRNELNVEPLVLVAYGIALVTATLGMVVPDSATALAESRAYALLVTLLAPPDLEANGPDNG